MNFDSNYVKKDKYYVLVPFSKDLVFKNIGLQQFKVSHSIPTYAYGLITYSNKLKKEYQNLSQDEIRILAKKKINLSDKIGTKFLLYATDFEESSLKDLPLGEYQYVIIECTFFYDEHYEEAIKRKHLHWKMIEPYLIKYSETKFILMHLSQRYKDDDLDNISSLIDSYSNATLL